MSDPGAPDDFGRLLTEASALLADFRRVGGLPPATPPAAGPDVPPSRELRAALAEAAERLSLLEAELRGARQQALESASEARRSTAELTDLRRAVEEAEARLVPLREKATLLAAECVRLESMRHKAESEAAEAESAGRGVADDLRRRLREASAEAERARAESAAHEAKNKAEIESLTKRLLSTVTRLQALEGEKRLEAARGVGEGSALQAELERARAVVTALRAELFSSRESAERTEAELRHQLRAVKLLSEEMRAESDEARAAAERREAELRRLLNDRKE